MKKNTVVYFFLAAMILLIAGFLLSGCSAAAKKESYHQSGPISQERGEGNYHKAQVVIEKYGKKFDPYDSVAIDNGTIVEKEPVREYTPPKIHKSQNTIVITKEGDVYQKEVRGD